MTAEEKLAEIAELCHEAEDALPGPLSRLFAHVRTAFILEIIEDADD